MRHQALEDGLKVGLSGLALYGAAAGIETVSGGGPVFSAVMEEAGKALLLLAFGWIGWKGACERNPLRLARARALGLARGLSLGLVAVAVFAGVENLAYLTAFREAGILARLVWSLPVHLVAALAEALGVLCLFRAPWRRLIGLSLWGGMVGFATAWHIAANLLVSRQLAFSTFTGGTVAANLLFLVLLLQFLRHAYLGGFLHGAD